MTTVTSAGEWRNKQWKDEESTNAILKRDTGVDVHGSDKTWRQTKTDQQEHVGVAGRAEIGVTALKGLEVAEVAELGTTAAVTLPVAAFVVGWCGLVEAHRNGDEQNAAIERDQAHVALAGALDLPPGCRQRELDARPNVPRDHQSKAAAMTNKLMNDRPALAVLQAHCDRGVLSAYASAPNPMPAGMTVEKFLDTHPQLKEICDDDAAFRVGFEAFFKGTPAERTELLGNVQKHDIRSGQTGITIGG